MMEKKTLQVFISYCTADEEKMLALKACFCDLQKEYASNGVDLKICEMKTCCAGEWDVWMERAIKESDVVVSLLTDSLYTKEGEPAKLIRHELIMAQNGGKGIVPVVLTMRDLPDGYNSIIAGWSQVRYIGGNDNDGWIKPTVDKTKILLDRILRGENVGQGDSVRIGSGHATKIDRFVGRKKEMALLREKLTEGNVVILKGEGGIGKTSLAENFFDQNRDLYDQAYIVTASNGLRRGISNIDFESTRYIDDEQKKYEENKRLLGTLSKKTIIILDNCDEEISIDELEELAHKQCRFVITSRVGVCNGERADWTIEIGRMQEEDLLALIYKHYPDILADNGGDRKAVEENLLQFFDDIDGHTLTVEMAAVIMREGDLSVQEMREQILRCNEMCKTRHDGKRSATPIDHLSVLYDYAKISGEQKEILSAVCLFAPTVGIKRKELKNLLGLQSNNEINALVEKTYLKKNEGNMIRMHPLFADVFYLRSQVADRKQQNAKAITYITEIENDPWDLEGFEKKSILLEYLLQERLDAFADDLDGKLLLSRVYDRCVECFCAIHKGELAGVYCEKKIQLLESLPKDKKVLECLAGTYMDFVESFDHVKNDYDAKALQIYESIYADEKDCLTLAEAYLRVGAYYLYSNGGDVEDFDMAYDLHKKAQEIYETVYAHDFFHPDLITLYIALCGMHTVVHEYTLAIGYGDKAMRICESIKTDRMQREKLMDACLGMALACELWEYGKTHARKYRERALNLLKGMASEWEHEDDTPRKNWELSKLYRMMASLCKSMIEMKMELEYYFKAIECEKKLYPDGRSHMLFWLYEQVGRYYFYLPVGFERAIEYYQKCIEIGEMIYADSPIFVGTCYDGLAAVYLKMKEPEKALYYRKKGAEILGFDFYEGLQSFETMLENDFPNDETAGG